MGGGLDGEVIFVLIAELQRQVDLLEGNEGAVTRLGSRLVALVDALRERLKGGEGEGTVALVNLRMALESMLEMVMEVNCGEWRGGGNDGLMNRKVQSMACVVQRAVDAMRLIGPVAFVNGARFNAGLEFDESLMEALMVSASGRRGERESWYVRRKDVEISDRPAWKGRHGGACVGRHGEKEVALMRVFYSGDCEDLLEIRKEMGRVADSCVHPRIVTVRGGWYPDGPAESEIRLASGIEEDLEDEKLREESPFLIIDAARCRNLLVYLKEEG